MSCGWVRIEEENNRRMRGKEGCDCSLWLVLDLYIGRERSQRTTEKFVTCNSHDTQLEGAPQTTIVLSRELVERVSHQAFLNISG